MALFVISLAARLRPPEPNGGKARMVRVAPGVHGWVPRMPGKVGRSMCSAAGAGRRWALCARWARYVCEADAIAARRWALREGSIRLSGWRLRGLWMPRRCRRV